MILSVIKRNSQTVPFQASKITQAISKAFSQNGELDLAKNETESQRLTPIVIDLLKQRIGENVPTVEQVQDTVEQVLMAAGHYQTAKGYILYRATHSKERAAKSVIGVEDDLNLSLNQLKVIEKRYLKHDDNGQVLETPKQMFQRVASVVAANEKENQKVWEEKFLQEMVSLRFIPGGCYLRGAGNIKPMLANCFVLPIEDDMGAIFDSVRWMALIHQKGGGTGFNFSSLRPKGDFVLSSGGFSSGPISFMKIFDAATKQVMQGGFRRGANMGILNIDHPDILEFINCKSQENEITNFNISVGITDEFMQAVESDSSFGLRNPRNGEVVQTINARNLMNQIATLAWRTGDPGVIFLDTINRFNPLLETLGPLMATNPCGEQPLHPFDVCNLGSLNLAKCVVSVDGKNTIDWKQLEQTLQIAVRFLDNGVDVSTYPIEQVTKTAQANRRIGLGVMGFADLLYQLEVVYGSSESLSLAARLMNFIQTVTHKESEKLAQEKGVFSNWKGSSFEKQGLKQRNLAISTIAPTGTISMVADCSSGIEPVFALSFNKNVVDENGLMYINPYFKKAIEKAFPSLEKQEAIWREVAKAGTCQGIEEIPESIRKVFLTAHDIDWKAHIEVQASFQKYTDNAVSKTINFPHDASIEEVFNAYMLSWQSGCKGVTIYRDGSKKVQILDRKSGQDSQNIHSDNTLIIQSKLKVETLKERIKKNEGEKQIEAAKTLFVNKPDPHPVHPKPSKKLIFKSTESEEGKSENLCPECGATPSMVEGCVTCYSCGWSKCSL